MNSSPKPKTSKSTLETPKSQNNNSKPLAPPSAKPLKPTKPQLTFFILCNLYLLCNLILAVSSAHNGAHTGLTFCFDGCPPLKYGISVFWQSFLGAGLFFPVSPLILAAVIFLAFFLIRFHRSLKYLISQIAVILVVALTAFFGVHLPFAKADRCLAQDLSTIKSLLIEAYGSAANSLTIAPVASPENLSATACLENDVAYAVSAPDLTSAFSVTLSKDKTSLTSSYYNTQYLADHQANLEVSLRQLLSLPDSQSLAISKYTTLAKHSSLQASLKPLALDEYDLDITLETPYDEPAVVETIKTFMQKYYAAFPENTGANTITFRLICCQQTPHTEIIVGRKAVFDGTLLLSVYQDNDFVRSLTVNL